MTPFDSYIAQAAIELRTKSQRDIQRETALVWAGRACAAQMIGLQRDATEYAHESIEHAALSGDDALLCGARQLFQSCGIVL